MLPIIIFSAVVPIVLVVLILGTLMKKQAATDKLIRTGIPARGRILQLGATGGSVAVMGHRHLKLVLTVEVHPMNAMPYVATFEQLISELQIASVQPGAEVELRIDPQNPSKIAMAGVVPPGMGGQQQAWGAGGAGGGWKQPAQGYGHAPIPMGVAQPNYKRSIPFIVFMMFITTVPITVIMLYTFVDFSSLTGSSDEEETTASDESDGKKKKKKKGSVCEQAAECCKVVGGDNASCDNVKLMPVEGCKQMLDGQKKAAEAQGKSCD